MAKKRDNEPTREETMRKHLFDLREEAGLSKLALANELNINVQTYRAYETDGKSMPTEIAETLADKFHVSLDYLLDRTEYRSIGNEELSAITGLSEDAINSIRAYSKRNFGCIDLERLLCCKSLDSFLSSALQVATSCAVCMNSPVDNVVTMFGHYCIDHRLSEKKAVANRKTILHKFEQYYENGVNSRNHLAAALYSYQHGADQLLHDYRLQIASRFTFPGLNCVMSVSEVLSDITHRLDCYRESTMPEDDEPLF